MPYNFAFSGKNDTVGLEIFNAMLDICFILDVFVNFRTSYVTEATGEEILDLKIIAWQYFKGRFWIDFIASIPIDIFSYFFIGDLQSGWALEMISLLKLVRVLRLSRLITYMNLKNDLKMSLKLVKLVFFLVLFIHCLACTWWFIVKQNKEWLPPLDYVYVTTDLYTYSDFHKY